MDRAGYSTSGGKVQGTEEEFYTVLLIHSGNNQHSAARHTWAHIAETLSSISSPKGLCDSVYPWPFNRHGRVVIGKRDLRLGAGP